MAQPDPIQIMVVDDQSTVRRGLRISLSIFDEFHIIGEAADGAEAVQLCHKISPHVILMDLRMPGMDGLAATAQIKQKFPHIKVIVFSSFIEQPLAQEVLQAGASCYLIKNISIDELADAIRVVNNNNSEQRLKVPNYSP